MPSPTRRAIALAVLTAAIVVAACGGSGPAPFPPANTTPSTAAEQSTDTQQERQPSAVAEPRDALEDAVPAAAEQSIDTQQERQPSAVAEPRDALEDAVPTAAQRSEDAQQQRSAAAEPSADRQEQRDDSIAAITGFSAVSAGGEHTCAIHDNGAIACWGNNRYGQADPPVGSFSTVSAGGGHTCGLRTDGAIECWGGDYSYRRTDPPAGSFSAVSAGGEHTCAIRDSGAIVCWGRNGGWEIRYPIVSFSAVSVGGDHGCGLLTDGAIACWNSRELIDAPDGSFSAVSAGGGHTCAIHDSGAIECWGSNDERQSIPPTGSFTAVSAGGEHTCAIHDSGAIECWGSNDERQSIPPTGSFTTVSAGGEHTCGLRTDGATVCWGGNGSWQADPPGSFSAVSVGGWSGGFGRGGHTCGLSESGAIECWGANHYRQADAPAGSFSAVSAGSWHTCGLRESGAIECWGNDDERQSSPPAGSFSAVSAGGEHTCGLRESGAIECWGNDDERQSSPPAGSFSAVSAGSWHTCAIRDSGAIVCWGDNEKGQSNIPVGSFSAVSAGSGHTCAIRESGEIECWGSGSSGQAPTGAYRAVSAGSGHTCAIRDSGVIECWGNDVERQSSPPAGSFSAVSAGGVHTCGLRTDGATVCWGRENDIILPAAGAPPSYNMQPAAAPQQDEPDAASDPLKIAFLADYSGAIAEFGPAIETGVRLAVKHLNDAGGVFGQDVQVVTGDTGLDSTRAVEEARRLIEVEGAHAIVGPLASGITLAVAESVTGPANIPTISPSATSPQITLADDNGFLFRSTVSDAAQGPVLAQLAADEGYSNVSVLYVDNAYGQGLADAFLEAWGGESVSVAYAEGQTSYLAELQNVAGANGEVLIAVGYPTEAQVYIREALENGIFDTFLFVDGTKSQDLIDAIGQGFLNGMKGTAPSSGPESDSLRNFNAAYTAEYGELPSIPFVREAYDAAVAIGLAAASAGSTDGVLLRDHLRAVAAPDGAVISAGAEGVAAGLRALANGESVNYEGAATTVDWNAAGDVTTGFIGVWQFAGGGIEEIAVIPVPVSD